MTRLWLEQPVFAGAEYITTFRGHDVYIVHHERGTSIVARYGNVDCEYASMPVEVFKGMVGTDRKMGLEGGGVLPMEKYLFSEYVTPATAAMAYGLMMYGISKLVKEC